MPIVVTGAQMLQSLGVAALHAAPPLRAATELGQRGSNLVSVPPLLLAQG